MKVLGVVCSPRRNGNTQLAVETALEAAGALGLETELYLAGQKKIAPCDACDACRESGECCVDDDMQELYVKLLEADGIILASPVYYWNVSAQAKAVIDRTFAFRRGRPLTGKVGGALAVGQNRGDTSALNAMLAFFAIQRLAVAAASTARGHEMGSVRMDTFGMEESRRVGRAVAELLLARRRG